MNKLTSSLLLVVLVGCGSAETPVGLEADSAPPPDTLTAYDSGTTAAEDTATEVADTAPPVDDDLAAAQALVNKLTLGVNVERGWAWEQNKPAYWDYLRKTVGVTHVRLFYPWRTTINMGGGGPGNAPPDESQFNRILDAADAAIKAGLVVFLDCTDVMGIEDFTDAAAQYIDNCATWTAKRKLNPKMFALGPVNEWAGGDDNTLYNKLRQDFQAVLRAKLPGYVLTTGAAYWKSRDFLYDASKKFEVFDDLRVVYDWHHYSSLDAEGWRAEEKKLDDWRKTHGGRPTICGEAGAGYWDESVPGGKLSSTPSSWPSRFKQMLPNIAADKPTLWAITYGGEYRLNKSGDDPYLDDEMLSIFKDGAASSK